MRHSNFAYYPAGHATNLPKAFLKKRILKTLITRGTSGWRWRIMADTDQLATGIERTADRAQSSASKARKEIET